MKTELFTDLKDEQTRLKNELTAQLRETIRTVTQATTYKHSKCRQY